MAKLTLQLAILMTAVTVWTAVGASYSYNGLSWQDGYTIGGWGSDFAGAKAYAKSFDIPLVTVWANPGCGYCRSFENAAGGASVTAWAKARGYLLVFTMGYSADPAYGMTESNVDAAFSFARGGSLTKFPFIGVWWPKDASGQEVRKSFSGRSGLMPVTSGSLAQQFMDSVDHLVGDYAHVAPKTVTVTFDGGTTGTRTTRVVILGSTLGTLPKPTRDNYLFEGWFTDKTYATAVSSAAKATGNVTYYALWKKAVTLKATVSPSAAGTVSGTGTFPEKSTVTLKATAKSGYVFSWWKQGTAKLSQEPTYACALGTAGVTLTAVFLATEKDFVTLEAKPAAEYERNAAIEPIAITTTGGSRVTLKAAGLPSGLVLKNGEIVGTPTKSGRYALKLTATTVGRKSVTKEFPILVRAADERVISVALAGTAVEGKVSGGGLIADGKKTTVKATPAKGFAFEGWYDGTTRLSQQATLAYVADGRDVTLTAKFVTVADDLASVSLAVDGLAQAATVVTTNRVQQGLALRWPLAAAALTPATVSVSGLPAGLKLEKTLVDKAEKLYGYALVGVPSAASKADAKTGLVKPTVAKVKVTTGAKNAVTYVEAFVVEPLPVWAYGTFAGASARNAEGEGVGIAKLTVSAAGKASGSFPVAATNGTFSVNGYTSLTETAATLVGEVKYGKRVCPLTVTVKPGASVGDGVSGIRALPASCSRVTVDQAELVATLYRNFWKDRLDLPSPALAKTALGDRGYPELTVSVSAAGQATFAGKLPDGTKVSSSAPVRFNAQGESSVFLIVPYTTKFGGYLDEVVFD